MNTETTPPSPQGPDSPDLSATQEVPHVTPTDPDTTDTPDTTAHRGLADEVFVDDTAGASPAPVATTSTTSAATSSAAPTASTATMERAEPPEQEWLKGPAPFALVLGLLGLVVAGATLLSELADVNVPWDDLGPWSVVAAGIVVLLVGAIGLRSSRTRG